MDHLTQESQLRMFDIFQALTSNTIQVFWCICIAHVSVQWHVTHQGITMHMYRNCISDPKRLLEHLKLDNRTNGELLQQPDDPNWPYQMLSFDLYQALVGLELLLMRRTIQRILKTILFLIHYPDILMSKKFLHIVIEIYLLALM